MLYRTFLLGVTFSPVTYSVHNILEICMNFLSFIYRRQWKNRRKHGNILGSHLFSFYFCEDYYFLNSEENGNTIM